MPLLAALLVLVAGDCASTFLYHVPQHAWFSLHLRTHHDRRRSYLDHAVLSLDPWVLLDGLLGAVPYLAVAAVAARLSWEGALAGLALGQVHVWWRHTSQIGWKTPAGLAVVLRQFYVVLPEDHDKHHRNPQVEFGDIFRFYDAPARALLARLVKGKRKGPSLRGAHGAPSL
ncbi:MAG: sterol desaturase family protein [Candidatus Tyrphobacter sp.]